MNYELKSVQPLSVFFNAVRIFVVVGFLVAILSFFILPSSNLAFGQKMIAVPLFTVVYTLVVSAVLSLIAFLYNIWAQNFSGVKIHLEQIGE